MSTWALQDAKSKFSQVVELANLGNPQIVTKRGKEAAVVLSYEDYCNLSKREGTLTEFFQSSPLANEDISFERNKDYDRELEL